MKTAARKYRWPEGEKIQVQIRKIPNTRGSKEKGTFETFGYSWLVTVPIKVSGKRRERLQFSTEEKAQEHAERVCKDAKELGTSVFELKPAERMDAMSSYTAAQKFIPEGFTLMGVLTDACSALNILKGHKLTLEAAARFVVERMPKTNRTVEEVVKEFIELRTKRTKKGTPASAKYLADLSRLEKFAADFPCSIAEVTPDQIDKWTDGKKLTGRTRFNYLRMIRTLFKYAQTKTYFPRTVDPMEGIDGVDSYQDDSEIEIFSPAEMREILGAARPEIIPFLALGAFAGLRSHSEIMRLDWSHILFDRGFIEIKPRNTKTASRRLVPLLDNLRAWLAPYRQESGPVCSFANMGKQIAWMVDDMNATRATERASKKFEWLHNALRHSFISYRLAVVKNTAQVAMEAGNSERMILKHYRELVDETQGAEWFGIVPAKTDSNIVPMAIHDGLQSSNRA